MTRNGRHIGDLVPARERRSFVSRSDFVEMSKQMPLVDYRTFRADLDRYVDDEAHDPYERTHRPGEPSEDT